LTIFGAVVRSSIKDLDCLISFADLYKVLSNNIYNKR